MLGAIDGGHHPEHGVAGPWEHGELVGELGDAGEEGVGVFGRDARMSVGSLTVASAWASARKFWRTEPSGVVLVPTMIVRPVSP